MFVADHYGFLSIYDNTYDFPHSRYKTSMLAINSMAGSGVAGELDVYDPKSNFYATLYLLITDPSSIVDLQETPESVDVGYMILAGVNPRCLADVPQRILDGLRGLYLLAGSDEPSEDQETVEIHLPKLREYIVYSGALNGSGIDIKFDPGTLEVLAFVTSSRGNHEPFETGLRPFDGSMKSLKALELSDHFPIDLSDPHVPDTLEDLWYRGDETIDSMIPHLAKSQRLKTISIRRMSDDTPAVDLKSLGPLPNLLYLRVDSANGLPSELKASKDLEYISVQFKVPSSGLIHITSDCLKFPRLRNARLCMEPTLDGNWITYEDGAFDELTKCRTLQISASYTDSIDDGIQELYKNHSLIGLNLLCADPLMVDDVMSKMPGITLQLELFRINDEEQDRIAERLLEHRMINRSFSLRDSIVRARRRFEQSGLKG